MKHWPETAIGHYSAISRFIQNLVQHLYMRNLAFLESWNIQNPSIIAFHCIFRIVSYLRIFRSLTYLKSDTYSEPCHVENPSIFITRDIFRTLSRHILAYSECCVMLAYLEPCHTQNFGKFSLKYAWPIFRILFL